MHLLAKGFFLINDTKLLELGAYLHFIFLRVASRKSM